MAENNSRGAHDNEDVKQTIFYFQGNSLHLLTLRVLLQLLQNVIMNVKTEGSFYSGLSKVFLKSEMLLLGLKMQDGVIFQTKGRAFVN